MLGYARARAEMPHTQRCRRSRREPLPGIAAWLVLAVACSPAESPLAGGDASDPGPPNLVLVLFDDAGVGDFGSADGTVATPHLDRLAAAGTTFTRAYASAPVCSPTRAAILTGRHPARYGIRRGIVARSYRGIPPAVVTLPERLRRAGYLTAHIGKWHLGTRDPVHRPGAQGFDHTVERSFDPAPDGRGVYWDPVISIDGEREVRHRGHQTEILTDYAIRFVRENRDRRFFLNLWYKAPHAPLEPPPAWAERYADDEAGRYAALMGFADAQVGRLLDALDELGLSGRTLVVATSDNGSVAAWGPLRLRGSKSTVYEGGIRVPLVVRGPGVAAGAHSDALVASVDLYPTLADLVGLDTSELGLDGESFRAALAGGAPAPRAAPLVWEVKGVVNARTLPEDNLSRWAVRRGPFKLVHTLEGRELFDVMADPRERRDLLQERPALRAELERDYLAWRLSVPRIEPRVASLEGSAAPIPGGWHLDEGARVQLAPDPLYDIDDGDFSFACRVALDPGATGERAIARRAGSWELRVGADGRLLLAVERDGVAPLVLGSGRALRPGVEAQVAFTVLGFKYSQNVARLFIDARLEAAAMELTNVPRSDAGIVLGGDGFRGTLRDVSLHVASLLPQELAALAAAPSHRAPTPTP